MAREHETPPGQDPTSIADLEAVEERRSSVGVRGRELAERLPSFLASSRKDEKWLGQLLLRLRVLDATTGAPVPNPSLALNGAPLPECDVAPSGSLSIQHRISPGALLSVGAPGCVTKSIRLRSRFWRLAPGGEDWEADIGFVLLGEATQVKVLGTAAPSDGRPSQAQFFVLDENEKTVAQRYPDPSSPGKDGSFLVALSGADCGGVLAAVSSAGISIATLRPRDLTSQEVELAPVEAVDFSVRCALAPEPTPGPQGRCTVGIWHDGAVGTLIQMAERTNPELRRHLGFQAEATLNGDPVVLRAIQSTSATASDEGHRAIVCLAQVEDRNLMGSLRLSGMPSHELSTAVHQISLGPRLRAPPSPPQDAIEIAVLDKGTELLVEAPVTVTFRGRIGVMPSSRFLLELPQGNTWTAVVAAPGYVTQIARIDGGASDEGSISVRLPRSSPTPVRVVDQSGQPIVGAMLALQDSHRRSNQRTTRVRTDEDGAFLLTDIAKGQVLEFSRPRISTTYSGIRGLHPRQVVGGAGQQTIVAERLLGSVNVHVEVSRRGAPLSDCHITHTLLMRASDEASAGESAYRVHREKLAHIEPSSVRLVGLSTGRWQFGAKLSDGSEGRCTFVVAGNDAGDLHVRCDTGWSATLKGHVTGKIPQEALPNASVVWVDASYLSGPSNLTGRIRSAEQHWTVGGSARVERDGSFQVHGIPPGEILVQLVSPQGLTSEVKAVTLKSSPAENPVQLRALPAFATDLSGIRNSDVAKLARTQRRGNKTIALELRSENRTIARWTGQELVSMIESDGAVAVAAIAPTRLRLVALSKNDSTAPEILWTTSCESPTVRRWVPFE